MRLWRRASGALKDHSSIWRCSVSSTSSRRSRPPDLEAIIIKATSHDDTRIDYKNAQRVFSWIRASPPDQVIKPLVCFLSMRLQKTRSWVVALKGLMLFHGVLRCNIPDIENLGRLPFDLSSFTDTHSKSSWGYNTLVRAYFTFLDHKSTSISLSSKSTRFITHLLSLYDILHCSLELLLQIRPHPSAMIETRGGRTIILEAMDCIVMEVFDVYTRICVCLKKLVSPNMLHAASKKEAIMVLQVLQQSNDQREELHQFVEFYKNLGVVNASDISKIEYVTQNEIREVQRIAKEKDHYKDGSSGSSSSSQIVAVTDWSADSIVPYVDDHQRLTSTIITEKWEVFEDDLNTSSLPLSVTSSAITDSLTASQLSVVVPSNVHVYKQEIPDFITF